MRTAIGKSGQYTVAISPQHPRLPKEHHAHRRGADLGGPRHRMPAPTQRRVIVGELASGHGF
jgi:hypothetical protein